MGNRITEVCAMSNSAHELGSIIAMDVAATANCIATRCSERKNICDTNVAISAGDGYAYNHNNGKQYGV